MPTACSTPTSSRPDPGARLPTLGPVRGTALYVAAVLGPGVLTLPALAAQVAGPAFLLALVALLVLSVPLAATFAALGRLPAEHGARPGLPGHVARAFGPRAGRVVAALFYLGVPPGVAALGLFGGGYLQAVVGGTHTAPVTAGLLVLVTWALNGAGLRASATVQVVLTGVLLVGVLVTVVLAIPDLDVDRFAPVAPHGWGALFPATFLLVWVLTGWEASANLATALPPAALRRVVGTAVAVVAAAFVGLSVALVGVLGVDDLEHAPVARLLGATVGPAAGALAVTLALVLTLGNMNAYVASLRALGAGIPRARGVVGGPLTLPSLIALGSLLATLGRDDAETLLVGVTAASQVPVLVLALAAGARSLPAGAARRGAALATAATSVLLVPAGRYLLVPGLIVAGVLVWELLPRTGSTTDVTAPSSARPRRRARRRRSSPRTAGSPGTPRAGRSRRAR